MNIKALKSLLPELLILGSILYYWIASSLLNPIAIVLFIIIGYQIIKQKSGLGIIISLIFIILNLYMVLALFSELSEFKSANHDFKIMLLVGGLYLGLNLFLGFSMLIKYLKKANAKQLHQSVS
ncbi:hypothetical protein [Winogradskyella sp.]|jgi:threonine/homoserine/homoserine lactone efflux protein|uniref:hypothetical protein n=1 Tax=Winogradskyella sp. TaxID=1883156 RepID=UPI0025FDD5CB|nr:hypothetical protein [Winogradskyella sp.]MCT4629945.1 hypothetical protein [Winogradskyella sp.]